MRQAPLARRLRLHQFNKVIKQRCRVVWPGARFGVTLEAECRHISAMNSLQSAVKQ